MRSRVAGWPRKLRIQVALTGPWCRAVARLDELETDLVKRRTRAEAEGWAGEIEGIDMTLSFLRAKREDSQRRLRRPAVDLGIPILPRSADQQKKQK
jgi:hypothetical protein